MPLSKELLEILACPQCKQGIVLDETRNLLVCPQCQLGYPIRDDIPVMLIPEAVDLRKGEK
jgi:uncharacterized protein YbaR (Trm112 family)